jgi:hypothetical protein
MNHVHIYTANDQPATDYLDHNIEPPMRFTNPSRRRLYCWECERGRWAMNLVVHVYYDSTRFFCKEGHTWSGRKRRLVTKEV